MGWLGLIYIGQSQQFYYLILVSLTSQIKDTVKQAISMRLMKRIQLRSPRVAPPGGARGKKIAPPLPSPAAAAAGLLRGGGGPPPAAKGGRGV
jgi:hypothetical protein